MYHWSYSRHIIREAYVNVFKAYVTSVWLPTELWEKQIRSLDPVDTRCNHICLQNFLFVSIFILEIHITESAVYAPAMMQRGVPEEIVANSKRGSNANVKRARKSQATRVHLEPAVIRSLGEWPTANRRVFVPTSAQDRVRVAQLLAAVSLYAGAQGRTVGLRRRVHVTGEGTRYRSDGMRVSSRCGDCHPIPSNIAFVSSLALVALALFERSSTSAAKYAASPRWVLPVCTRRSSRVEEKKITHIHTKGRRRGWEERGQRGRRWTSFIPMHKRALVQALTFPSIFSPFSFPRAPRAPRAAIVIGFSFRDRAKTARWKYITGSQLQPDCRRPGIGRRATGNRTPLYRISRCTHRGARNGFVVLWSQQRERERHVRGHLRRFQNSYQAFTPSGQNTTTAKTEICVSQELSRGSQLLLEASER